MRPRDLIPLLAALLATAAPLAAQASPPEHEPPPDDSSRAVIAETMDDRHWLMRAVAAMRLEGWDDPRAVPLLVQLADDHDWRVRSFAVRSLARRTDGRDALADLVDANAQVMRTALFYGVAVNEKRLRRQLAGLRSPRDLDDAMLYVELAALSGDADAYARAIDLLVQLVQRLDAFELLLLSDRLGPACGLPVDADRAAWTRWLQQHAEGAAPLHPTPCTGRPMWMIGTTDDVEPDAQSADSRPQPFTNAIAGMDDSRFVAFRDDYLRSLQQQPIDLVICIDRTTSMRPTIDAVKTSALRMMAFLEDSVASVRFGVVTYAGRPDELQHLPLTARQFTVQKFVRSIDLGRGAMETVTLALHTAINENTFRTRALKAVIVIGDEPYQKRFRTELHELLDDATQRGITVCTVKAGSAARRTTAPASAFLSEFDEIAHRGGGRSAALERPSDISTLIVALAIGGSWPEPLGDLLAVYEECTR